MAEKRMFTKKIVDSDSFLNMPLSAQSLYFHLNMRADDDGFVNNPKVIQRMIGASEDDLKLLIVKRFIIIFDNGVVVIKHWRMHNILRKDRYCPTQYQEQFQQLGIKENGSYTEQENLLGNQMATKWQPNGNQMATQYSIDKNSIDKNSIDKNSIDKKNIEEETIHRFGMYHNVKLKNSEVSKLIESYGEDEFKMCVQKLDLWLQDAPKAKKREYEKKESHYLSITRWVKDAVEEDIKRGRSSLARKEETLPTYDSSHNPEVDQERLNELLERRRNVTK